jgi:hypothetical protein
MSTYDLATNAGNVAWKSQGKNPFQETDLISFAGYVQGDILQVLDIPANSIVEQVFMKVVAPETGASAFTIDVGYTGLTADGYFAAFDMFAASAGIELQAVSAGYGPDNVIGVVFDATDTLDILVKAVTGVLADGSVKLYAKILNLA